MCFLLRSLPPPPFGHLPRQAGEDSSAQIPAKVQQRPHEQSEGAGASPSGENCAEHKQKTAALKARAALAAGVKSLRLLARSDRPGAL